MKERSHIWDIENKREAKMIMIQKTLSYPGTWRNSKRQV